jgi:hypothetical protein
MPKKTFDLLPQSGVLPGGTTFSQDPSGRVTGMGPGVSSETVATQDPGTGRISAQGPRSPFVQRPQPPSMDPVDFFSPEPGLPAAGDPRWKDDQDRWYLMFADRFHDQKFSNLEDYTAFVQDIEEFGVRFADRPELRSFIKAKAAEFMPPQVRRDLEQRMAKIKARQEREAAYNDIDARNESLKARGSSMRLGYDGKNYFEKDSPDLKHKREMIKMYQEDAKNTMNLIYQQNKAIDSGGREIDTTALEDRLEYLNAKIVELDPPPTAEAEDIAPVTGGNKEIRTGMFGRATSQTEEDRASIEAEISELRGLRKTREVEKKLQIGLDQMTEDSILDAYKNGIISREEAEIVASQKGWQ